LKDGDVIVRFNGEEVTSTRKLTRLIGEVAPDHQAKITIQRNGREQDVTATLGKRPAPKFADGNFMLRAPMPPMAPMTPMPNLKDFPRVDGPQIYGVPDGEGRSLIWRAGEGRMIGVGVTSLTKQLAAHFGVESGVMINNVRENSPAAKAGLKAGDIVVEVDGKAVKREMDLIRSINEKKEGDVTLTIVRNGNRQTVTVTPERSKESGFFFETEDKDDGK
jgi:S1-C subfamily serine protease